jgi:hypothetical protein
MLLNYAGHCEASFAGSLLNEGLSVLLCPPADAEHEGESEKKKDEE